MSLVYGSPNRHYIFKCFIRNDSKMASKPDSTGGTDKMDHQATIDSGLKMKIMRSKSTDGREPKLKIIKDESNGQQPLTNVAASGSSSASKTKSDEASKSKQSHQTKGDNTMLNVSGLSANYHSQPKDLSNANCGDNVDGGDNLYFSPSAAEKQRSSKPKTSSVAKREGQVNSTETSMGPPSKRRKSAKETTDRCVGTSFGTLTEPECLGPCEPGTSVNLDGIVWHETEDGILVVNATWRGRSYIGTLLDSTRHEWAPPRPSDGNEEWDCRTRAGRAKRRSAAFTPEINNSLNSKQRGNIVKTRGSRDGLSNNESLSLKASETTSFPEFLRSDSEKLFGGVSAIEAANDSSQSQSLLNPITGLHVEIVSKHSPTVAPCPISPVLLECPEENCNKKFRHSNGLRYHQSHAHGSDILDAEEESLPSFDGDYEGRPANVVSRPPEKEIPNDTKDDKTSCDKKPEEHKKLSSIISRTSANGEKKPSPGIDPDRENTRSPAYSDISDDSFSTSEFIDHLLETKLLDSKKSQDLLERSSNSFSSFHAPQQFYRFENTLPQQNPILQNPSSKKASQNPQPPSLDSDKSKDRSSSPQTLVRLPGQGGATSSTFINPYNSNIVKQEPNEEVSNILKKDPIIGSTNFEKDNILSKNFDSNDVKIKPEKIKSPPTFLPETPSPSLPKAGTYSSPASAIKVPTTEPLPNLGNMKNTPGRSHSKKPSQSPLENKESLKTFEKKSSSSSQSRRDKEPIFNKPSKQQPAQNQQYQKPAIFHPAFGPTGPQNYYQQQLPNIMNPPPPPNPMPIGKDPRDMEPIKIKQEPKTSPTERPPPTMPQFLPTTPFLSPSYAFNQPQPAPFSPYPSNLVPNHPYSTPPGNPQSMSRYHMPSDLPPMNSGPPNMPQQNYSNAVYPPNMANVPDMNSMNFGGPPQTPPGHPAPVNRTQNNTPDNKTSPQTHFHTHHHTHVGLGYPMYPAPYEAVLTGQQPTAAAIITPFSPPPPK